jgi:Domain of unknown function (DUF6089)
MKRIFYAHCILMLCALPALLFAQPDFSDDLYYNNKVTYEIGTSLGIMNCFTDLGGKKGTGKGFIKDINIANTQPAATIYLSAAYKYALVLRSEATWGVVKASDKILKDVKESTLGRYDRNLSFRSTIFELMLAAEIHPRYFKKYKAKEKLPRFSPYALAGIGYFVFNPQTRYKGQYVDLKPLRTEGQGFAEYPDRKPYKLKQFNFPVGAGIRYKMSSSVNVGAECVYRILNTDYLDDVSTKYIDRKLFQKYMPAGLAATAEALYDRQKEINPNYIPVSGEIRGNPQKNDSYFSFVFKVGYIF